MWFLPLLLALLLATPLASYARTVTTFTECSAAAHSDYAKSGALLEWGQPSRLHWTFCAMHASTLTHASTVQVEMVPTSGGAALLSRNVTICSSEAACRSQLRSSIYPSCMSGTTAAPSLIAPPADVAYTAQLTLLEKNGVAIAKFCSA